MSQFPDKENQLIPEPLRGFRFSLNKTADHIEKASGLQFQQKPLLIVTTPDNERVLVSKLKNAEDDPFLKILDWARGLYIPSLNVIVLNQSDQSIIAALDRGRSREGTLLHENWHALMAQRNPDIDPNENPKSIEERIKRRKSRNEDGSIYDPEKDLTRHAFVEGFADFGALFTAEALPEVYDCETIRLIRYSTFQYFRPGGRFVSRMEKLPDGYFDRFENWVNGSKSIFQEECRLNINVIINAVNSSEINRLAHAVGYFFSKDAKDCLENQGMTTQRALDFLIQNPPSYLHELKDAKSFVDTSLKSSNPWR